MKDAPPPRRARRRWQALSLASALLLTGCQSYRPEPLSLSQHQAAVATRLIDDEPLAAFADRLASNRDTAIEPFDPSDGISPAEAEVIALFYNSDLRLTRLRAGVALATKEHAGRWQDPVFGFDGAEVFSPSGPFEFGLTAGLTIPVSGRLAVEKAHASAAYEAQLRRVVDAEWQMRMDVRAAWADWSVAVKRLELIDQIIEELDRIGAVSDRLERAGELTRGEARLLKSQRVALRVEQIAVQGQADQSHLKLMGLMGLMPGAPVTLLPTMQMIDVPETDANPERLIQSNTVLAVARADYHVAEESLRLEIRKQYPDIEIGGGFGSEGGDDRLLLGVSFPVALLNANRGGIAEARASRKLLRATAQTEFERLALALAGARAQLDAVQQQRALLESDMLPMLDAQAAEIDRLAELGEVNTLILLETVTRRFEAKNRILDLHLAQHATQIEIARLLGPDEIAGPAPAMESTHTQPTKPGNDDAAQGASQ